MKKLFPKLALAALAICGAILMPTPAEAISYYDAYGRAYYYNVWGQPVYYETGYNTPPDTATYYSTQTTYQQPQPTYQQQPSLAAVPAQPVYQQQQQQQVYSSSSYTPATYAPAPATYAPADSSATTYQYYYPDGTAASTTYVSTRTPVASSTCRQSSRTEQRYGELQTVYYTECMQSDGTWLEQ